MSLRVRVVCDGLVQPGAIPCGGSVTTDPPLDGLRALAVARGWHLTPKADLCPAHARAAKETT